MRALVLAALLAACTSSTPATSPAKPAATGLTGAVDEATFKAMHAPPTTGTAPARRGQAITLGTTKAYLALPAGPGPHPGIVVIHEWWGKNEHIEHWADRLASAGWAAVAVDLYSGTVATDPDTAMATMKAVDNTAAAATITTALEFLATDPRVLAPKRVVIGWCFGGAWSLQTALAHPEIDGAIVYYGKLETDVTALGAIKAKLLGVFGNLDQGIPPEKVTEFETALRAAKVDAQILRYDAEHGFANPSNPKYAEVPAADAWKHVLAFLAQVR